MIEWLNANIPAKNFTNDNITVYKHQHFCGATGVALACVYGDTPPGLLDIRTLVEVLTPLSENGSVLNLQGPQTWS